MTVNSTISLSKSSRLKAEPFIPLNPRGQQPDKTLGSHSLPLCPAGLEMKFNGISPDTGRTRKKFRCPILAGTKKEKESLPSQCPINHDRFCTGKCYGCTAYIDITDDYRSQVPRESKRFKDTYKCRTEVELNATRSAAYRRGLCFETGKKFIA